MKTDTPDNNMEHLIPFLHEHLGIVALLLILIIGFIWLEFKTSTRGVKALSTQEAIQLLNQKNSLALDFRGADHFAEGHISKAKNVTLDDLKTATDRFKKHLKSPVIVICDNGQKSSQAGAKLKRAGFEQVYLLRQGLALWRKENLPLIKEPS